MLLLLSYTFEFLQHPSHRQYCFFFFNDPPPTEIYTLSLHDALPICESSIKRVVPRRSRACRANCASGWLEPASERNPVSSASVRVRYCAAATRYASIPWSLAPAVGDRKSTRLNSSHGYISYAVFCLQ